jgi:uncharacterized phage protein (TIGR01671 family)
MKMQELKVRVWDEECRSMLTDDDVNIRIESGRISAYEDVFEEWGMEQREIKNPIFLRYTGLKDRNGREIYEGDILANKKAFNRSFKVIWNPDGAWFVHDGDDWPCYYLRQVNKSTEVIGNVFEHPELLEVKKV